jgi:hypothetical protein
MRIGYLAFHQPTGVVQSGRRRIAEPRAQRPVLCPRPKHAANDSRFGDDHRCASAASTVEVGDVLLCQLGRGRAVAHRVHQVQRGHDGERRFILRGDSCTTSDPAVDAAHVQGKVVSVEREGRRIARPRAPENLGKAPGPRDRETESTRALGSGRGERIRTSDILLPKQTRYQAAPRPEILVSRSLAHLSRTSRTAVASAEGEYGLGRKLMPSASTPSWAMASAV